MTNTYDAVDAALKDSRLKGDRFAVTVLSTLLGEMQNKIPKDVVGEQRDVQAVAIVKKFIESVNENFGFSNDTNEELAREREILETFMPSQLTDSQLASAIEKIMVASDTNNKGVVMKVLKTQYPNRYDGSKAVQIVDDMIRNQRPPSLYV